MTKQATVTEMKAPTRRKISVRQIKLSEQPIGFKFMGIYRGESKGQTFQQVNQKTGEVSEKQLSSVIMEDLASGERTAYLADKGLLGALADALVKVGDKIEVVKLEKTNIGKGRTMNQYDIFALE